MQFKIFVSYSTDDIEEVELLKHQLEGTPIDVFIAEHTIKPSEDLTDKISKGITECDLFVVLWSNNAKESGWVSQEIGRASALNKVILPLLLTEGLEVSGFINNVKYIPVYKNKSSAMIEAKDIIVSSYDKKFKELAQAKQRNSEALAKMGIGAFVLWLLNK